MENSNSLKIFPATLSSLFSWYLLFICGFDFKIRLFVCQSMNGKDIWLLNINETKEVKEKIVGKKCK